MDPELCERNCDTCNVVEICTRDFPVEEKS